jgi:hypothetical protein
MEKHQVTMLATAILMQNHDSLRNIENNEGKEFKGRFTLFQKILEELYDASKSNGNRS